MAIVVVVAVSQVAVVVTFVVATVAGLSSWLMSCLSFVSFTCSLIAATPPQPLLVVAADELEKCCW